MIRSLYSASSGMKAQQFQLDTIANNLANVNTTGFKKNRVDFQDLLYQQLRVPTEQKPTGMDVGTGVRVSATLGDFQQGILQETGNDLDVAIEGRGFFQVELPNGNTGYTRNGAFRQDQEGYIVNSDGYRVLDDGGSPIQISPEAREIQIDEMGEVFALLEGGNLEGVGTIGLVSFVNPAGLEKLGGSIYLPTTASGDPQEGTAGTDGFGLIRQRFVEGSNVQIVEEMVKMITAQRAYEINSKMIQTTDEIMGLTNNLKR